VRPGPPPEPAVSALALNSKKNKPGGVYVVQMGDTPFSITRRAGIAITDLLAWNSIDATRPIIHVGDTLKLAAPERGAVETAEPADATPAADTFSSMWEDTAWTDDWASAFTSADRQDSVRIVPSINDTVPDTVPINPGSK
jgi:LysM repeat protein